MVLEHSFEQTVSFPKYMSNAKHNRCLEEGPQTADEPLDQDSHWPRRESNLPPESSWYGTIPVLENLFQLSLNLGKVPENWREASIVSLYKNGTRHQSFNYRPVSLTSTTCMLLEYILHSNVMHHFDMHDVVCNSQHGFRVRLSSVPSIHEIASYAAMGRQVDVILLDFVNATALWRQEMDTFISNQP